jgi:preprotein translocase subunit SecG
MLEKIFMGLFLLTAVILSLLVLIQRGRGGGLAGAFGGAGGSSAFGTKTADIFIKATAVLGGLFFVLAILTAWLMRTGTPLFARWVRRPTAQRT